MTTFLRDFLLQAATSVPSWRSDAIGFLLVVIAGCLLLVGWMVTAK